MLVVKVGGSAGINLNAVCAEVAAVVRAGQRVVLVHGGSQRTNEVATALGHPPRFVTSPSGYTSRRTDRATLEIFEMVYCGQINKGIVERLQQHGVNALGLAGVDGGLWRGPRKAALRVMEAGRPLILRDDYTGTVEQVNAPLLHALLDTGYLPVLTPPALSYDREAINVDGDRAAAATAVALGAETLVILSNVPGLLRDFPDEASLIPRLTLDELDEGMGLAHGRMRPKLLGTREALAGGVRRVILGDARHPQPLRHALAGHGTVVEAAGRVASVQG